jgi:GAF domain-containing protein
LNPISEPPDQRALLQERQDAVVREIHSAAESAATALEVFRTGLARVTPLVEASFASVFLRDEDAPHLLRLACAQNWPQSSARFLGELRIREGLGPTGQAVAEASPVEVVDVFEDPELREWWEPARELGFTAMTAHPLTVGDRVIGSISFYFKDRQPLDDDVRALLATVARELPTAAEAVGP